VGAVNTHGIVLFKLLKWDKTEDRMPAMWRKFPVGQKFPGCPAVAKDGPEYR